MRHAYTGERVPRFLTKPVYEGWLDGRRIATLNEPCLYRTGFWERLGWWIGRTLAALSLKEAPDGR